MAPYAKTTEETDNTDIYYHHAQIRELFPSTMVAYADDLLLYKPVESNADYNRVQEDVTTIDYWMSYNFLTLNATKCKHMVITRSRSHQCPQLFLAGQPLECVQSYKYLGVIITSNLSWSEHIQSICNKSRKLVGLLYRQFYLNADSDTLRQFYRHASDHTLNMRAQYGTLTWQKRKPFWRQYKSLLAKCAVKTGTWTMRVCWPI